MNAFISSVKNIKFNKKDFNTNFVNFFIFSQSAKFSIKGNGFPLLKSLLQQFASSDFLLMSKCDIHIILILTRNMLILSE